MATATERARIRADLGLTAAEMGDTEIDELFVRAAESYSSSADIYAYARLIVLDQLIIQAAREVDYEQNDSSEKASQRYAQLSKLRKMWQEDFAVQVAKGRSSMQVFGMKRKPARKADYPDA